MPAYTRMTHYMYVSYPVTVVPVHDADCPGPRAGASTFHFKLQCDKFVGLLEGGGRKETYTSSVGKVKREKNVGMAGRR